jgi:hypothetical protein
MKHFSKEKSKTTLSYALLVLIAFLVGLITFRLINALKMINMPWSITISTILGLGIGYMIWILNRRYPMLLRGIVAFVFLLIGIIFIFSSNNTGFWDEAQKLLNISALGVGLTTAAIGFAFLFAFYPLSIKKDRNQQVHTAQKLDRNIDKLSKEINRIEKIVADCKNLTEEMRRLKEETNKNTN